MRPKDVSVIQHQMWGGACEGQRNDTNSSQRTTCTDEGIGIKDDNEREN